MPDESEQAQRSRNEARNQVRGSSLLTVGRVGAMGANMVTQVLIIRYLATADFGAFAYALSILALASSLAALGLDRAIPRFIPLYEERRQYGALFGTVAAVVSAIVALGAAAILLVHGLQGWLLGNVIDDQLAISLLLILILLAPIEALDAFLTDFFAVFGRARAIFIRRYVIAPALRLGLAVLVVVGGFDVLFLAAGWVATGLLGFVLYAIMVPALLRARGLLAAFDVREVRFEGKQVLGYTIPLLTMDLVLVSMLAIDAMVLGATHGTEAVGSLRAIEPAARANTLIAASFALLFVPVATRFFARDDHDAVKGLYWQTTAWMAVASFPIFILTFALAEPLTVFLFGERYRESAIFLALIALGRYFDSAFGANGLTLRVYGRIKELVAINLGTAAFHLAAALLLIPRFGALGAALAVCITFIGYNIAKQVALQRYTGVPMFDSRYTRIYVTIIATLAAVTLLQLLFDLPVLAGMVLAGLACLLVLLVGRHVLQVQDTFPELLRLPGARLVLGR